MRRPASAMQSSHQADVIVRKESFQPPELERQVVYRVHAY